MVTIVFVRHLIACTWCLTELLFREFSIRDPNNAVQQVRGVVHYSSTYPVNRRQVADTSEWVIANIFLYQVYYY